MDISLRAIRTEDETKLIALYASSRPDIDWICGMGAVEKKELIESQYMLERDYIRKEYPTALLKVILFGEDIIGRFYINHSDTNIRIIAISLFPEYRRKGIASRLICFVQKEAANSGKIVRLNVMWYNREARLLYERLGFMVMEDMGISCEMQWKYTDDQILNVK